MKGEGTPSKVPPTGGEDFSRGFLVLPPLATETYQKGIPPRVGLQR